MCVCDEDDDRVMKWKSQGIVSPLSLPHPEVDALHN